jgi:hypothetical protein
MTKINAKKHLGRIGKCGSHFSRKRLSNNARWSKTKLERIGKCGLHFRRKRLSNNAKWSRTKLEIFDWKLKAQCGRQRESTENSKT